MIFTKPESTNLLIIVLIKGFKLFFTQISYKLYSFFFYFDHNRKLLPTWKTKQRIFRKFEIRENMWWVIPSLRISFCQLLELHTLWHGLVHELEKNIRVGIGIEVKLLHKTFFNWPKLCKSMAFPTNSQKVDIKSSLPSKHYISKNFN